MAEIKRTLPGLAPDARYIVRVRGYSQLGIPSEFSEAIMVTTPTDSSTPKAPTALNLDWDTPDLIISWDPPTENVDESVLTDFSRYRVDIYEGVDTSGPPDVSYETFVPFFTFTLAHNKQYFNPPADEITVEVFALDIHGNESSAASDTKTHPGPFQPPAPSLDANVTSVNIDMSPATQDLGEVKEFRLYHSEDNVDYDLITVTTNGVYTHTGLDPDSIHYYKFEIVDVFSRTSPMSDGSNTSTPPAEGDGDGLAPPQPTGVKLISGPGQILVKWNDISQPGDGPVYEVHLFTDDDMDDPPSATTKVGQTSAELYAIREEPDDDLLDPDTDYYVRIVAKDSDYSTAGPSEPSDLAGPVRIQPITEDGLPVIFADTIVSGDGIIHRLVIGEDPDDPGVFGSIESVNYIEENDGWKIGTGPTGDSVEFNSGLFRGDLIAESLSLEGSLTAADAETPAPTIYDLTVVESGNTSASMYPPTGWDTTDPSTTTWTRHPRTYNAGSNQTTSDSIRATLPQSGVFGGYQTVLKSPHPNTSDLDITYRFQTSNLAPSTIHGGLMFRGTGSDLSSDLFGYGVGITNVSGNMRVRIHKLYQELMGMTNLDITDTASTTNQPTYAINTWYKARVRVQNQILRVRVWLDGNTEPTNWHATAYDFSYSTGWIGLWARRDYSTGESTVQVIWDDVTVYSPELSFNVDSTGYVWSGTSTLSEAGVVWQPNGVFRSANNLYAAELTAGQVTHRHPTTLSTIYAVEGMQRWTHPGTGTKYNEWSVGVPSQSSFGLQNDRFRIQTNEIFVSQPTYPGVQLGGGVQIKHYGNYALEIEANPNGNSDSVTSGTLQIGLFTQTNMGIHNNGFQVRTTGSVAANLHFNPYGGDIYAWSTSGDPTLFLRSNQAASTTDNTGGLVVGNSGGAQLALDINTVVARPGGGGAATTLGINHVNDTGASINFGPNTARGVQYWANAPGSRPFLRGFDSDVNSAVRWGDTAILIRNRADTAYIPIQASVFDVSSSPVVKVNTEDFSGALATIKKIKPKRYQLKYDIATHGADKAKWNLGLMTNDPSLPSEIVKKAENEEDDAISLYDFTTLTFRGLQELIDEVESLRAEVKKFKDK